MVLQMDWCVMCSHNVMHLTQNPAATACYVNKVEMLLAVSRSCDHAVNHCMPRLMEMPCDWVSCYYGLYTGCQILYVGSMFKHWDYWINVRQPIGCSFLDILYNLYSPSVCKKGSPKGKRSLWEKYSKVDWQERTLKDSVITNTIINLNLLSS